MPVSALVAFNSGAAASTDQTVADGVTHTLIPVVHGSAGKVVVQLKNSEGKYTHLKNLGFRDKEWQITGPATYKVKVRNAGCDVDTGA